jgi:hypothetical protein
MRKLAFLLALVPFLAGRAPLAAQEFDKPGPEHEVLKKFVGEWEATLKMEGLEAKGSMVWKSTLGGLWVSADYKGEIGGMTHLGHGMTGYDLRKKKYVDHWFDSMTSSSMAFEGDYDKATKSFTMVGEGPGPDGKPAKYKSVTKMVDDATIEFAMAIVGKDGKDAPMMTMVYKRKK